MKSGLLICLLIAFHWRILVSINNLWKPDDQPIIPLICSSYIMTKRGIKKASADVGFMFTAYNLRRIFNILDKNVLIKYLERLASYYSVIFRQIRLHLVSFHASIFQSQLNVLFINDPSNLLIFNQNLIKTVGFKTNCRWA